MVHLHANITLIHIKLYSSSSSPFFSFLFPSSFPLTPPHPHFLLPSSSSCSAGNYIQDLTQAKHIIYPPSPQLHLSPSIFFV